MLAQHFAPMCLYYVYVCLCYRFFTLAVGAALRFHVMEGGDGKVSDIGYFNLPACFFGSRRVSQKAAIWMLSPFM